MLPPAYRDCRGLRSPPPCEGSCHQWPAGVPSIMHRHRAIAVGGQTIFTDSRFHRLRANMLFSQRSSAAGHHSAPGHLGGVRIVIRRGTVGDGMRFNAAANQIVDEGTTLRPVLEHHRRGEKRLLSTQIRPMTHFNHEVTDVSWNTLRVMRVPCVCQSIHMPSEQSWMLLLAMTVSNAAWNLMPATSHPKNSRFNAM